MCKLEMNHSSRVTWNSIYQIMWNNSDTIEAREGTVDSVPARGRNELSKFRDFIFF